MKLAQSGKTCGRGVLALKSWEPLRKPGSTSNSNLKSKESANKSTSGQSIPTPPNTDNGTNSILLAKYSYKANPDQPGGFPELTVKQGQKVQFINVHISQPLWWNIKEEGGNTGYVPASYMMVINNKPSGLPWLENKRLEEKKDQEAQAKTGIFAAPVNTWKPYVSAYGGAVSGPPGATNQERKYYCEICDKQLNGPKPYQAHMLSKAHKDEVEVQSYNP